MMEAIKYILIYYFFATMITSIMLYVLIGKSGSKRFMFVLEPSFNLRISLVTGWFGTPLLILPFLYILYVVEISGSMSWEEIGTHFDDINNDDENLFD
jgi:hypothetical protein